ncbi:hypothetical protein GCM10022631_21050 [Deinococcus rubellus]|uniref:ABM domain-containing protein n=1 Tax=Deinococcus rubellus TaxID=1889240 RepID=A0ABY5YHD8_9DEIO|nr:hypothetical protein [Deinococcus rubellus]UWX64474.1 hypothetical protein N0D28_02040 [Deinococcus rubellus]
MSQRRFVHYMEGRGADAEQTLSDLLSGLPGWAGLVDACLLTSPDQPGLWLLESRWANAVPLLDVPEGCKSWSFEVQRLVSGSR